MTRRFVISVIVMFIVSMALGFLVHGVLLADKYAQLLNLFRQGKDAESQFPYMLLAHLFMAFGLVWVYLKGKENKPFLTQGICYGAAMATLVTIPMYLIYYAVQPMPGVLVFQQIVFDTIGMLVMGIIVAWLNR
jgi:hypothetical protein